MKDKFLIVLIICLTIIICNYINKKEYLIYHSNKTNCDILLNTRTGDTWFNHEGWWKKLSKDIANNL